MHPSLNWGHRFEPNFFIRVKIKIIQASVFFLNIFFKIYCFDVIAKCVMKRLIFILGVVIVQIKIIFIKNLVRYFKWSKKVLISGRGVNNIGSSFNSGIAANCDSTTDFYYFVRIIFFV